MYGTVALTNDPSRPQYNDLVALYVAEVGLGAGKTDLDPYTSNQYDAAILTLLAMQAAGTTTDGAAIQKAMFAVSHGRGTSATPYGPADVGDAITALQQGHDINYQGASGDVDFDAQGDVVADFLVWQVQGTGFVNHDTISATLLAASQ
jgi:branched-chain amino acid transport system substrate-binding protein